jgi:hypothetical protein
MSSEEIAARYAHGRRVCEASPRCCKSAVEYLEAAMDSLEILAADDGDTDDAVEDSFNLGIAVVAAQLNALAKRLAEARAADSIAEPACLHADYLTEILDHIVRHALAQNLQRA